MAEQRPYRHRGLKFDFNELGDPNSEWLGDRPELYKDGFLYIKRFKHNVFVFQSCGTGELVINKIVKRTIYLPPGSLPQELRLSTAPIAERQLPGQLTVRGEPSTYFNRLLMWQEIAEDTYSLWFEYCNGGSLLNLREAYREANRPVPEHFIWQVMLTVFEGIVYLSTGRVPGGDDDVDANWIPIRHRDIADNNIFISYPFNDEEPGAESRGNAFPEIQIGDFGEAAVEGDDENQVSGGSWDDNEVEEYQDTYGLFRELKSLCMAHIPYNASYKGDTVSALIWQEMMFRAEDINGFMGDNETPYSDALINFLKMWEFPGSEKGPYLTDDNEEEDGAKNQGS
ncbi:hypothetical protein F5Y16DRAFT_402618 [Xylariaceae sp. FL0255]|nr:hypothetical protein F5Y16DRAFT_402618 [Xylariaceae sp. FL0255]